MKIKFVLPVVLSGIFLASCGMKEGAVSLKNKVFGGDTESSSTATPSSDSELTGMLLVLDPEQCPLASGCGPQYSLFGRNFSTQIALSGDIDPSHNRLILSVTGEPSSLPEDLKSQSGYERISAIVQVEQYRLRSSIPYHPFLVEESTKYTTETFGCDLLWDKSYSWSIEQGVSEMSVTMKDTLSNNPQPWVKLTFDGNSGQLLNTASEPEGINPCN